MKKPNQQKYIFFSILPKQIDLYDNVQDYKVHSLCVWNCLYIEEKKKDYNYLINNNNNNNKWSCCWIILRIINPTLTGNKYLKKKKKKIVHDIVK